MDEQNAWTVNAAASAEEGKHILHVRIPESNTSAR